MVPNAATGEVTELTIAEVQLVAAGYASADLSPEYANININVNVFCCRCGGSGSDRVSLGIRPLNFA